MNFTRFILLFIAVPALAQKPEVIAGYISSYQQFAVDEQVRTGIPAAITMAQAIHESGAGQGDLALKSNNHFGIKCKSSWTGATVFHDDDSAGECFRSYTCVADSYRDHSDFLRTGKRYAFLFDIPPTDYYAWANGLKQAGYATNPRYAEIISKIIEDNDLETLTETALNQTGNTIWLAASKPAAATTVASNEKPVKLPVAEATPEKTAAEPVPARQGVFHINHCKAVFVAAGASLRKIAVRYNLDYTDLLHYNDMKPVEKLASNQVIFLEEKRKKGNEKTHQVQRGETAWLISQQEGIRLEKLLAYNQLKPGSPLKAGQVLKLR